MASSSPPRGQDQALATTKRKFDNLLDRLTNVTNPSTTSFGATLTLRSSASATSLADSISSEHTSKRSRRLSDVLMDSPRVVSGERVAAIKEKLYTPQKAEVKRWTTVGKSVRAVGKTPVKETTPRKPANYQPYSQEQFLDRLKTFADRKKWPQKPGPIIEVEWAKQGWICVDWNVVGCKGGCEQRVAVKLRPKGKDKDGRDVDNTEDVTAKFDEGLVEKYRQLIVDGHHEDCLWRRRGCSSKSQHSFDFTTLSFLDDIYHIPLANRAKSTADFLLRYRSLKTVAENLPILENIKYPDPRVDDVLRQTPSSFFSPPGSDITESRPTTPTETVAFLCAIFGWQGKLDQRLPMIVCNYCHQRNGLWLYEDTHLKEMATKLDVPLLHLRMDLLLGHRDHCPWINPESQSNPLDGPIANMAGWQTQEFMMMGKKKERQMVAHHKNVESVDLGSDYTMSRSGSLDDTGSFAKEDEDKESRWKKFKAKLRRTTSKKSLRSVRSAKSVKSISEKDKGKENDAGA
ncbi:zf-C3HC-domain-containing protein [Massarina eburnea CBS 473.64]|uniref:Zf-C3HC-domain-containing protein n=1 Tax=Massarina eburnea CBS 473.64 TaxID=1395130 RepID=A0A6A6S8V5_9PLEO|nr:zf-C3HC-domain-containing protein [Massarina eburnea CBS 473.64]